MDEQEYNYENSGFGPFLTRPLGSEGRMESPPMRQLNFDQQQISGSLGDSFRFGNVTIDGVSGRITVNDGNHQRVFIGSLPDGDYGIAISKEGFSVEEAF